MERNLRGRKIDFQPVIDHITQGERIKAKHDIENFLTGITSTVTTSALAILRYIEKNSKAPENEELLQIVNEKESADAKRKLDVANMKAKSAKAYSEKAQEALTPRCPTCGSTSVTRQGIVGRAVTSAIIGGFAPESRAQFRCNKCGYMW